MNNPLRRLASVVALMFASLLISSTRRHWRSTSFSGDQVPW